MTATPIGVATRRMAARVPDRTAITAVAEDGSERTISWRELERRSNRLARAYLELGVRPDTYVTIGLPNGIEHYEAVLATWKAGAIPQPTSSRLAPAERAAILDLVEPSLVVGADPADESAGGRPAVPVGFEPGDALSDGPLPDHVASSLKAATSGGSTGQPKVIVSTQPASLESLTGLATLLRMRGDDGVHLATGPLFHNGPFQSSVTALLNGNHVVVMARFDAARTLSLVERHRVDWLYVVPTMMHRIWRLPDGERTERDLSSLAAVWHMAAPCPQWLKRAWIDWLGADRLFELYGGTEAQSFTVITGSEWLAHPGSVGRPAFGEIEVRDDDGTPAPPGMVGRVWMRRGSGEPAPYRYLGAEPRRDADGWECLGDMGSLDADGYLYLADRDTDMILVGGANVYPAEVEAALEEHSLVRGACVIGLPDDDMGNIVHALVQLDADVSDESLLAHLRTRVSSHKLPRSFERVDAPLRDDAGKVRRSGLRAERLSRSASPR